jgi:hypothetical protein
MKTWEMAELEELNIEETADCFNQIVFGNCPWHGPKPNGGNGNGGNGNGEEVDPLS